MKVDDLVVELAEKLAEWLVDYLAGLSVGLKVDWLDDSTVVMRDFLWVVLWVLMMVGN